MFKNQHTNAKDVLRYEGPGPDIDPELLALHVNRAPSNTLPSSVAMSATPEAMEGDPTQSVQTFSDEDDEENDDEDNNETIQA